MINFCHASLKPVITCDKVCADDYGVENLICGVNYWASQRGFRSERFIIPPVSVTVRFPCNIQLAKIVIDPVVGRQKSSGFEIFASTRRVQNSWLTQDDNNSTETFSSEEEIFGPIGKEILNEPCIVCFENLAYKPRQPFNLIQDESSRGSKSSILRRHRIAGLSSVSAVTIRIVQTVERSSPALKRLEIWGQPAVSCPVNLQKTIFQLYSKAKAVQNYEGLNPGITEDSTFLNTPSTEQQKPATSVNKSCVVPSSSVDVPEEFIDPITCDIMTVPLTLPSGKTIDQLTLDKHTQAESKWGRPPSDPFTGVPYDNAKKPIPNVPLKLRIDQFVLNHSSELKTVPRVLGRGQTTHWVQPPSHTATQTSVKTHRTEEPTATYCPSKILHTSGYEKRKYDEICSSTETSNAKTVKLEISDADKKLEFEKTSNHESKLNQSLDAALHAALGGLPSFHKLRTNLKESTIPLGDFSTSVQVQHTCVYCNKNNVSLTLYTLACEHYSCKTCLSQTLGGTSSGACKACGKRFFSKDVAKLNV